MSSQHTVLQFYSIVCVETGHHSSLAEDFPTALNFLRFHLTEECLRDANLVPSGDEIEAEDVRDGDVVVIQLSQQLLGERRQERFQDDSQQDRQIETQRDDGVASLLVACLEVIPRLLLLQIEIALRGYVDDGDPQAFLQAHLIQCLDVKCQLEEKNPNYFSTLTQFG